MGNLGEGLGIGPYEELVAAGQIKREETTVVVLTSTGVKATPAVAKVIGEEI